MTDEELEALKIHHIEPEKPRRRLTVLGTGDAPVDEPSSEKKGRHPDVDETTDDALRAAIVAALHTVYDPEIPVDIYRLGLVYGIEIDPAREVTVRMTLTAPGCPVAGSLVDEVARKAAEVPGVAHAKVDLVFEPPWTMDCMSEDAKLELGLL